MNTSRVLVTGMGVVSCIGMNAEENFQHLLAGQSGIGNISILQTQHRGIMPAGEISFTNEELAQRAGVQNSKYYSRTTLLALIAAKEAIQQAGASTLPAPRTGLISATTVGGMDKSENFFGPWLDHKPHHLSDILTHDCGDSTNKLAQYFGIHEYVTTISTACSSAANAIMLGARLIRQGQLDRVIVGGSDALTRFTVNGFNTLMILDKELCTPFDENRHGLNLGEGAAYLVLESERAAAGKKIYALVSGYANANDAFHQTASSPDGKGALLAMSGALATAGLSAEEIDYINVHGTGTPNNDITEGTAIEKLFDGNIPAYSSTKAYTGHTLAACGAIEAIYSIYAINHGVVYPNLRFKEKIKDLKSQPVTELQHKKVRHVLSNSFGFGGNNTSLILSEL
ncbi:MAG TPA: beta-ketoacyl-[acyl-carrier-protein] synthase family protein [Cytophagaceae bacterium]|nr:beta-ketoacyl-[acyl-carrier-protein] synthase family protein [Cytophagaceae bacterium]